MTATMPTEQRVPDPVTVLKHVDDRLARRAGDDPLPAETILEFGRGIQEQIVQPLLAGAAAGPDPAVAAELERVKGELADELEDHERHASGLLRERNTAQYERDAARAEAVQLRESRAALWELLKAAVRERRQAWAHAAEIEDALTAARKDAAMWESEYERVRDGKLDELAEAKRQHAERSSSDGERHRHYYPVNAPGELPQPCACNHPYPRAHLAEPREDVPAAEPEPWADLFAGIRADLADWRPQ